MLYSASALCVSCIVTEMGDLSSVSNGHHIRTLDTEAPSSEMYSEQVRNNCPGLAREAEDIREQLGIQSVNKQ